MENKGENKHIDKKILKRTARQGPSGRTLVDISTNTAVVGVKRAYSKAQAKVDSGLGTKPSKQPRPQSCSENSTGPVAGSSTDDKGENKHIDKKVLKRTERQGPSHGTLVDITTNTAVVGVKRAYSKAQATVGPGLVRELSKQPRPQLCSENSTGPVGGSSTGVQNKPAIDKKQTKKIIDIDEDSIFYVPIYAKEIYKNLTSLEEQFRIIPNHLYKQTYITEHIRATHIDWLMDINTHFSMSVETFQLTVGIIDRYLQVVDVHEDWMQLISVTAMFIASKYEEVYPLSAAQLIDVTDNSYTKVELLSCERTVLATLGFRLSRPTPLSFLKRFMKAAQGNSKDYYLARYFTDLSLVEYSMSHYRPSEIAAAAVCLAVHVLSRKTLQRVWTRTLKYYSNYDLEHIYPIIKKIASLVKNVENSEHTAVFRKYSGNSCLKVSTLPQLKRKRICELVDSN